MTRQSAPKRELLRFVLDPERRLVLDLEQRLPGRGMWLSAERDVVNRAVAKNLFAKAARASVRVEPDLALRIEERLARRTLDTLGLARRAGEAVLGFEQVCAALRAGTAGVLLAAADGAADGRARVRRLAPNLPLITAFSREQLGAALGRESVVHVAVMPGRLARRLLEDVGRLSGFRSGAMACLGHASTRNDLTVQATTGSR